jgi:hypothetical protein
MVAVMVNDGTKLYDHPRDGSGQLQGSCIRDFRNKPMPILLKIEYVNQALTVSESVEILFFNQSILFFDRSTSTMACRRMRQRWNFVPVLIMCNCLRPAFSA